MYLTQLLLPLHDKETIAKQISSRRSVDLGLHHHQAVISDGTPLAPVFDT